MILYSSGTTGAPKCILHRAGVVLQHLKEVGLHADVKPGDRLFFYTTLGWMMWNWLVSALGQGATILLYDGSPFHPGPGVLWDLAERERVTHFGTSPKYLDTLRKHGVRPGGGATSARCGPFSRPARRRPTLSTSSMTRSRRTCTSPPSRGHRHPVVLRPGRPHAARLAGEIRVGPRPAVEVRRSDGAPAASGERGELVCTAPFPAMPLGFWGDADKAATVLPTSSAFPASGATVTSPRSPRTEASLSTAARTRR